MKEKKAPIRTIVAVIVIFAILIVALNSFVVIPSGYTGVKIKFGQISEQTVQNGINFKIPFIEKIEKVNNKQQDVTFEGQIWSETSNRTAIYYDGITVTYQIAKDKSAWIYANVTNYKDALVTSNLVASAIKESSKDLSDSDATNRGKIEPLTMENLQASLDEKYGEDVIIINKVTISNTDFDDSYNQAIAEKQQAQIAYEKQQIENQTTLEKAQTEAEAKKIAAEADAEATKINAAAEAEANEELASSITQELIDMKLAEARLEHGWVTVQGVESIITDNN